MANKKHLKVIPSLFLSTLLLLSACTNKENGSSIVANTNIDFWSAYSTVKVTRNPDGEVYYDKLSPQVNISMMRNETESGQFFMTPDNDVSSYTVKPVALKRLGGDETIPLENIQVFAQKYMEVQSKFNVGNQSFVPGDYVPDMLLPIEKSVEFKENHILKNNNQGVTIDVKTTKDTIPGTYVGDFEVVADGATYKVPVRVKVWDIVRSGKSELQSCFLIYKMYLLQGEFNSTEEMVYNYYDFLLDYNVNSFVIRSDELNANAVETYTQEMLKRSQLDTFNSIVIPVYFPTDYKCDEGSATDQQVKEWCYQYIKSLTLASTEENSLVDLMYFYTTAFDEADAYGELLNKAVDFYKKDGEFDKTLDYVIDRLDKEGVYNSLISKGATASYVEHIKHEIKNVPTVWPTTTFDDTEVDDTIVTNCPVLSQFNTGIYRQRLMDAKANSDGNLWTYTCSAPRNPYPTFHLDDYNLGTRTSGWMMKKYDCNGYLYWAVNLCEPVGRFGSVDNYVDPYGTMERAGKCPGDGFLVYPGKYYGSENPFPSMRLEQYRDTTDDYDMLTIYERLLAQRSKQYGVEFELDDFVNDLYDSIFSGVNYIKDDELVFKAREELARRILEIQNDDQMVCQYESDGINYSATIYNNKPSLLIDGQAIDGVKCGNGYRYSVLVPVDGPGYFTVESEYLYKYKLPESGFMINQNTPCYGTKNSEAIINANNSVSCTVRSVYMDKGENIGGNTQRFEPGVSFVVDNLTKISTFSFSATNTSSETLEIKIIMSNEALDNEIDSISLLPGQTRTMIINLSTLSDSFLKSVSEMSFKMNNITTDKNGNMILCPERTFELSPIIFKGKAA